ncbi:MAG: YqaJ viral recombinase family protein [Zoogloeaceae bacterium]|nr:YqaJ viral recombinase family protein [Zoogloeaceae bacterium]
MKIIPIKQGTPEWHEFRRSHYNASDAAAMLGISPHKTRNELLKEYATGITPEVDEATQWRFKEGHRLEELARPKAERIIGDELFPVVGEWDDAKKEGLPLSASFDGFAETVIWEHKTMNERIQNAIDVPDYIMAQIQQQLLVSGASQALFTASEREGVIIRQERIHPGPEWLERIIYGWRQFQKDLEEWQPEAASDCVIGNTPETLPALSIRAEGRIITSNLTQYIAGARAIVAGIKTTLVTDQDFADAEKTVKWAKEAEESIDTTKAALLAQTADIGMAMNQMDALKGELREVRLKLDKAVKTEKENRKAEMVKSALLAFQSHTDVLREEIEGEWTSRVGNLPINFEQPYFGEVIKGLKNLSSIQNALDTELANAKIEAYAKAREYRAKLTWFWEVQQNFGEKFYDLQWFIDKPMDEFKATITLRFKEAAERKAARLEAERERIRKEEAARLEAEAKAKEAERRAAAQHAGQDAIAAAATRQVEAAKAFINDSLGAETIETANPLPPMDTDMIRAFLKTKSFDDEKRIRAVLVEFVKFCHQRSEK